MAGKFLNLLGTVLSSFGIGPASTRATLSASLLTAPRALTLQDKAGTIALTSDARVPTLVLTGETYVVPVRTQTLFAHPIELQGTGTLYISGVLMGVS